MEAMASHEPGTSSESNKTAEDDSKHTATPEGDLSELLEEVEEMYKTFHVSPTVIPKDSESGEVQPWHSRRLELRKGMENSVSSEGGSSWPPGQQAVRTKIPYSLKFQPRSDRLDFKPEWQEIDDLARCMRKILRRPKYKGGARLSLEDETKVRNVFEYHPKAEEKTGPGIDHIKIKEILDEYTHCFWVVRKDGTEIDFSYHKCLKAKVARECPDLLEHYEGLYMDYRKRDSERAQRQVDKKNSDLEFE